MLWTIIPVKSLTQTKSRLTAVLNPIERANLTLWLLARTLNLLTAVPAIDTILVVSRDKTVTQQANAFGAIVHAEQANSGLNGAVQEGKQVAQDHGATQCLILPSDLPTLSHADITDMLQWQTAVAQHHVAVICPDQHQQGTNGLLLNAKRPFHFQFGPNSLHHHLAEIAEHNLTPHILQRPGWQFDLDTAADWQILDDQDLEGQDLAPYLHKKEAGSLSKTGFPLQSP